MNTFSNLDRDYWTSFWIDHAGKTKEFSKSHVQVLRTINGRSIENDKFSVILESIFQTLKPQKTDVILDLCCGNGLITEPLATQANSVFAVDCSRELLEQINIDRYPNIKTFQQDIRQLSLSNQEFDKILIYAGIQYFTENEIIDLIKKCYKILKSGGLLFIGDIPDRTRLWNFFNSREREEAYFNSLEKCNPIIGTWIEPEWMIKLGQFLGYKKSSALEQSEQLPYSHYRFDIIYER